MKNIFAAPLYAALSLAGASIFIVSLLLENAFLRRGIGVVALAVVATRLGYLV